MNAEDIIFEQGEYKIKFVDTLPVPGYLIVAGVHKSTGGVKGFKFVLLKNDVPFKWFSVANGYPYNYPEMKSTAIHILKKFII